MKTYYKTSSTARPTSTVLMLFEVVVGAAKPFLISHDFGNYERHVCFVLTSSMVLSDGLFILVWECFMSSVFYYSISRGATGGLR